jgi:hypothetical protein
MRSFRNGERGMRERDDVGENLVSENALAMRILSSGTMRGPGTFSPPPSRWRFDGRGSGAPRPRRPQNSGIHQEDAPEIFVLAVNGDYPDGVSRSTMPGNVLQVLPALPKGLEYRIVGTHLILMDLDANIIVDYVLDVMCKDLLRIANDAHAHVLRAFCGRTGMACFACLAGQLLP